MRMDVNVRQERSEDWEAIQDINTQAFGRPAEARLVDRIRQSQGFIPELSLTAWQAERLVGHALFSRITLQTAAGHQKILALGPIAVLPQHQRRGVGSQLIRAGIEIATEAGWSGIILIGHPTYYPALALPRQVASVSKPLFPFLMKCSWHCPWAREA